MNAYVGFYPRANGFSFVVRWKDKAGTQRAKWFKDSEAANAFRRTLQ